jgi:hypothetical protein
VQDIFFVETLLETVYLLVSLLSHGRKYILNNSMHMVNCTKEISLFRGNMMNMKQVYINKGGKVGNITVVPHAIVDKGVKFFDADTALKLMDIIMAGGVVDFDGGVEEK